MESTWGDIVGDELGYAVGYAYADLQRPLTAISDDYTKSWCQVSCPVGGDVLAGDPDGNANTREYPYWRAS